MTHFCFTLAHLRAAPKQLSRGVVVEVPCGHHDWEYGSWPEPGLSVTVQWGPMARGKTDAGVKDAVAQGCRGA